MLVYPPSSALILHETDGIRASLACTVLHDELGRSPVHEALPDSCEERQHLSSVLSSFWHVFSLSSLSTMIVQHTLARPRPTWLLLCEPDDSSSPSLLSICRVSVLARRVKRESIKQVALLARRHLDARHGPEHISTSVTSASISVRAR